LHHQDDLLQIFPLPPKKAVLQHRRKTFATPVRVGFLYMLVHAMHILAFFHCLLTPIPIVVLNFRFGPSSFNCFKSIKLNFIFQNWILIMSIDIARSLYLGNKKTMLSSIPNKVNVKRSNWKKKLSDKKKSDLYLDSEKSFPNSFKKKQLTICLLVKCNYIEWTN